MTSVQTGRNRLSPAEYTLLGMIALASGGNKQIHGYDLHRQMTEGAIREIIRLEPGMLYHYLKKLTSRGLISSTIEPQEGRPDRHLHALTAAGQEAFDAWLAEPVQTTREMRLEFLLKLWFVRQIDTKRAATLIQSQRGVLQRLIDSLEHQFDQIPDTTDNDRFARKVIQLRLAQNRAAATWLDDLENVQ
jgi:DNA-binding PadR family transcriptional regulator